MDIHFSQDITVPDSIIVKQVSFLVLSSDHSQVSVNDMWVSFKSEVLSAIERFIPSKMTKTKYSLPWIDSSIKRLIRKRDKLYFRARKSSSPDIKNHYKRFRAHVQKSIRDAYWKHITNIFSFENDNPDPDCPRKNEKAKKFWSFVKSLKKDASGINTLRENGILKTDTLDKANICNRQFQSAFTRESDDEIPSKGTSPFTAMGEITVDPNGVIKLLNNLNIHKAPGPDGLSARVLKECSSEIAPVLTYIFNESLAQFAVPDDWRQANVAPVFKKGGRCGAANYRPVSLACVCCGTLGRVVVGSVGGRLALGGILAGCRRGFRGRGSCEARLVRFCRGLVGSLDRAVGRGRGRAGVVVVGFAGAFDRVPHGGLLCKLGFCGIGGSARGWIGSWLSGRSRGVVLDGRASGPVPVLSGVPRGSVLGPVLFLVFIDGLPDGIGSSVRLFAGDCVLYRDVGSPLDCRILQDDLNGLAGWEMDWQMGFSVGRCRSVGVARLHPGGHVGFGCTLRRRALGRVRSAGCLGLAVAGGLGWGRRVSGVACKAAGTLGFLRRSLALAPGRAGEVACGALVRPRLGCAAPVWRPGRGARVGRVEGVRGAAARWACGRWGSASSVGEMLDELEWPSLGSRGERSSLTFFYKMHSGAVSLDRDRCLAPAPGLGRARASHGSQCTGPFACGGALGDSFFPRAVPVWGGLPSSVVLSKTIEEFEASIWIISPEACVLVCLSSVSCK